MENDTTGFAKRLKRARKTAKLTQMELSNLSGVKQGLISNYEKGQRVPEAGTVKKLASILKMNPGDLLFGDGKKVTAQDAAKFTGLSVEACVLLSKMDDFMKEFFDSSIKSYERSA